ncbi:hypothetical protein QBC36DRAFT_371732 [Triangularia setosa]|uniref:SET domain-containing protein n=1 Tax=Triangularia setosa TaxID=2587417 RepID=A0AAN7A8M6_9PEZI|nr:hypothetical protein QBC36DRAFT_371732 [Podospora setosa]
MSDRTIAGTAAANNNNNNNNNINSSSSSSSSNNGKRSRDWGSDSDDPNKRPRIDLSSSPKTLSSQSSGDSEYRPPGNLQPPSSNEPRAETRAQREACGQQESGIVEPLVHLDPNKFPRRYMIDNVDLQTKYPIEDEVYEIGDYLIKYDDFGTYTPTRNTQLRRANADELPAQVKELVRLKGPQADIHACLVCDRWFVAGSKKCREDTCYYPMREDLAEWAADNISIQKTPGGRQGYGAYLRPGCEVKKGDYIGIYYGVVVAAGGEHVPDSAYVYSTNSHDGEYPFGIDSGMYGNWTRFSNSHCNPNCEVCPDQIGGIRVLAFRALRDIHENEEMTINYGSAYFTQQNPPMLCTCDDQPVPHSNRVTRVDIGSDSLVAKAATKSATIYGRRPSELPHFIKPWATNFAAAGPSGIIKRRRRDRQAPKQAPRSAAYIAAVKNAIDAQEVIEVVGHAIRVLGSDSDSSMSSLSEVFSFSDEEMEDNQMTRSIWRGT